MAGKRINRYNAAGRMRTYYVSGPNDVAPYEKAESEGYIYRTAVDARRAASGERTIGGGGVTLEHRQEAAEAAQEREEREPTRVSAEGELAPSGQSSITQTPLPAKQPETIYLNKPAQQPEKTGIAAYRESGTLGGNIVKAATSLKTTTVLGVILAGIATYGASIGAFSSTATTATTGRITMMKMAHEVSAKTGSMIPRGTIQTQRAIGKAGYEAKGAINKIFMKTGRVANNAKNFELKTSYLQKLASTAKNPYMVLGLLSTGFYTSLFWAQNEKGDALMSLSIAQGNALKNGQTDMVLEMHEQIQEIADIAASVPVIGFLQSEKAKFAAVLKASEAYVEEANKIMEEQRKVEETGETDFQRERRESDEAARERQMGYREEDEEYYADIESERMESAEEKRKSESEYYAKIEEKNRLRKVEEQRLWSQYYDLIREKRYNEAEQILKQIEEME